MTDLQRIVDALVSPIRREILWMLDAGEMAAGDIAAAFPVTKATMSTHLAVLRDAGLITARVDGNFRRYRAVPAALEPARALLAAEDGRWDVADDLPEAAGPVAGTFRMVEIAADMPASQTEVFRAFTDEATYSAFMGVPVTLRDGHFRCTLEWGTEVRGRYEVVVPPELIALRWDHDDEGVPVPGAARVGYLRVLAEAPDASRVVVHQAAADDDQAGFMTVAWSLVLGRLEAFLVSTATPTPRAPRAKRQHPRA